MRLIGNNRQLGAALRVSIGKIPNALGRAFSQNLRRFNMVIIDDFSQKAFNLVSFRRILFADGAADAANLTVLANCRRFVVAVTENMRSC